jgi:phosphatidylglycerophosphate synthase
MGTTPEGIPGRRPLKTRQRAWVQALARGLASAGIAPNQVSLASLAFAALAGAALVALPFAASAPLRAALLVAAAAGIQGRLLCNLLDGLVAIEGGRRTPLGEMYNDAPDRLADVAILAGAGYAARGVPYAVELGWAAAVVAVGTAYVRYLGTTMGAPAFFLGPMAKPHRMATLTGACVLGAAALTAGREIWPVLLTTALGVVVVGGSVTVVRRLRAIAAAVRTPREEDGAPR